VVNAISRSSAAESVSVATVCDYSGAVEAGVAARVIADLPGYACTASADDNHIVIAWRNRVSGLLRVFTATASESNATDIVFAAGTFARSPELNVYRSNIARTRPDVGSGSVVGSSTARHLGTDCSRERRTVELR
jgi:hypothetical protein